MIKKDISYLKDALLKDYGSWGKPPEYKPLTDNKWLLASCLQKAIRRGHANIATYAALNLYVTDKRMLKNRLLITAYEDIGIANTRALGQATLICSDLHLRREIGEANSYAYLAHTLAKSVKCRISDQIYMICNNDPDMKDIRDAINELDISLLMRFYLDTTQSSYWRAYAIQRLFKRSKCDTIQVLEQTHTSVPLIDACSVALTMTNIPLPAYIPMLDAGYSKSANIQSYDVPEPDMSTLPCYAFDGLHTRHGKEAIRQWKKRTLTLRPYTLKLIGKALFHTEGVLCDQELSSTALDKIKDKNVQISLTSGGLVVERHVELLHAVRENMISLNIIRKHMIEEIAPKQGILLG